MRLGLEEESREQEGALDNDEAGGTGSTGREQVLKGRSKDCLQTLPVAAVLVTGEAGLLQGSPGLYPLVHLMKQNKALARERVVEKGVKQGNQSWAGLCTPDTGRMGA